jgi:glutaredoxin
MNYTMVGRIGCTYCDMAKELIKANGGVVSYHSLNDERWILDLFGKSGLRTVPQIWDSEGTYIGGYSELREKLNDI